MMPSYMILAHFNLPDHLQTTPELRRLEMFNQAHREEMDAMLDGLRPQRNILHKRVVKAIPDNNSFWGRIAHTTRKGIGSALTSAGNRIHTPA